MTARLMTDSYKKLSNSILFNAHAKPFKDEARRTWALSEDIAGTRANSSAAPEADEFARRHFMWEGRGHDD